MLVEVARPIVLILNIISLYAVFKGAFLAPAVSLEQRVLDFLCLLALAGALSVVSGFIFLYGATSPAGRLRVGSTLPVQLFYWAASIMLALFLVSWYVDSHCIFYRDIRW